MKYWNKGKEVRERCWHKVLVTPVLGTGFGSASEAKITLQREPGNNKFYVGYENDYRYKTFGTLTSPVSRSGGLLTIWFENEKDATYFRLKWG